MLPPGGGKQMILKGGQNINQLQLIILYGKRHYFRLQAGFIGKKKEKSHQVVVVPIKWTETTAATDTYTHSHTQMKTKELRFQSSI